MRITRLPLRQVQYRNGFSKTAPVQLPTWWIARLQVLMLSTVHGESVEPLVIDQRWICMLNFVKALLEFAR